MIIKIKRNYIIVIASAILKHKTKKKKKLVKMEIL